MKIGMILDSIYPDDARITNQCEELINSKHEVFLFCLSSTGIFKIFIAWLPISITKDFAFSESRLNNEFEKNRNGSEKLNYISYTNLEAYSDIKFNVLRTLL